MKCGVESGECGSRSAQLSQKDLVEDVLDRMAPKRG